MDEFQAIACCATAAAQNADDQFRVIPCEFLHGATAVERHLEEEWTINLCHAGNAAQNVVIDEKRYLLRRQIFRRIGIEHFEEVAELVLHRIFAELIVGFEMGIVGGKVIVKRH